MDDTASTGRLYRTACTECQRRKQKCNKEWPCNHCQKRKVSDKCSFGPGAAIPDVCEKTSSHPATRKRQLSHEKQLTQAVSSPWEEEEWDFESLGYTSSHLFDGLSSGSTRKPKTVSKTYQQYYASVASCQQLQQALQVLPPRPYTDSLVQNFLDNANFHTYIIYPPSFLEEYRQWWTSRSKEQPLGLHWTCLLLTVCACSAQHTDVELERRLETDLGQPVQKLSEKYENSARALRSVIPVGKNHLLNVQSLLHSCLWHVGEGRFVESRHILGTAVREAQELGIHKEAVTGPMAEFDREVRRRVWCILDTWDWAISALLSRPALVDRSDCDVGLPNLTLEGYSPSPLLHLKLLSEVTKDLCRRFGSLKNIVRASQVREYQGMMQSWMNNLPKPYAFHHPDTSDDTIRPWIVRHRHNIQTMALTMVLEPFRPFLTRSMSERSSNEEIETRTAGVHYALLLIESLHKFFDHVYPRDVRFRHVLFCIFDTAAVLCSALIHDQDSTIPRRIEILTAIDRALATLKGLSRVAKMGKELFETLVKVAQRIQGSLPLLKPSILNARMTPVAKELVLTPPSLTQAEIAVASDAGCIERLASYSTPPNEPALYCTSASQSASQSASPPGHYTTSSKTPIYATTTPMFSDVSGSMMLGSLDGMQASAPVLDYSTANTTITPSNEDIYRPVDFAPISERDLGNLASLWNYEGLNLDFINPE